MLEKREYEDIFLSNEGWLESRFHFSFAHYQDFNHMNFGVLRVLNDDIIHGHSGFGMHPHNDMEIISYIVEGEITHTDSMGHEESLTKGDVQYMSAGTGVMHSEYNNTNADLRLLQIWIVPPQKGLTPLYGSKKFDKNESKNKLLKIVSTSQGDGAIKIYQDANIYVSHLDENKSILFKLDSSRQLYFVQIEGHSNINGVTLKHGDALKVVDENIVKIEAIKQSHFLCIEMNKG